MSYLEAVKNTDLRWDVLLPVVAAGVATLMIALASLSLYAFRQREDLALDGRVLGLAHEAELQLRETGREEVGELLEAILAQGRPEVRGVVLSDPEGTVLARAGEHGGDLASRSVELFVGQGGRGGVGSQGPPSVRGTRAQATGNRGGRGRLMLEFLLEPGAGQPPLTVRLLLPAALAVSLALVALAFLGGRLLVRQRKETLVEAQHRRLEALARAGAGLAHQLRTPLATIKGSCQLIAEQLGSSPVAQRIETVIGQTARMERMLSMLLDFARPPEPQRQPLDVARVFAEVAERRHRVRIDEADAGTVIADPDHFEQILDNLIDNAEAVSPESAPVELSARFHPGGATILIGDRGPGPGTEPEELFEPYMTTRADGTGLGLAIARNLAEANGGGLSLRAREGGGCEAVLTLPGARGEA